MPDSLPDTPPDALSAICARTRQDLADREAAVPLAAIKAKARAHKHGRPRGFGEALKNALIERKCGLIAEFKRCSPSGGDIRPGADPAEIARAYQRGGATCLSVLTEGPHFGGSLDDLRLVREAVPLPVLRKDFILEPWQVYESRTAGADCILLIMAALSDDQALELEGIARSLDLDVLVEVHDKHELNRALGLQTPLIGINNRDLRTLRSDIENTVRLAGDVPPDRILVTESGIRNNADLKRLAAVGAHCLLVGESLLREADVEAATRALLGHPA
jgi:indole-3-glycerol phosphate synthase